MVRKKNELSHYPNFFFARLVFKTISWMVFAMAFVGLGKKYANTDILGKIYQSIFGKKKDFNQYFLGTDKLTEKHQILNYAIYFLVAIIILNIAALVFNNYLWKKDRFIENNSFYLHNKWIFILNILIHIACACLLTLSFVSAFTLILALLFITFNSWEWMPQKKLRNPQTVIFFSWKNRYVRRILLYSVIVILVLPLLISRFQTFHKNALQGSPEGFAKVYQEMINSSAAIKSFMELITMANYSLFHWFILIWFVRGIMNSGRKEFSNFWTKVNGISKRVIDFKHYYYYQENWALVNNKFINLGDYNYLEKNPNFLGKDYLESSFDINEFTHKTQRVVKYIEFCESKIKETAKKNFLNYCLFNEFNSWTDCQRTKKLLLAIRKQ